MLWTPSKMVHRLGLEINDSSSIYYWAAKNNIPVFSPALTDGSLGDMMYFHSYKNPGLVLDIIQGNWIKFITLDITLCINYLIRKLLHVYQFYFEKLLVNIISYIK